MRHRIQMHDLLMHGFMRLVCIADILTVCTVTMWEQ